MDGMDGMDGIVAQDKARGPAHQLAITYEVPDGIADLGLGEVPDGEQGMT